MSFIDRIIEALRGDPAGKLHHHIEQVELHHDEVREELRKAQSQVDVLRELVTGMRGRGDVR